MSVRPVAVGIVGRGGHVAPAVLGIEERPLGEVPTEAEAPGQQGHVGVVLGPEAGHPGSRAIVQRLDAVPPRLAVGVGLQGHGVPRDLGGGIRLDFRGAPGVDVHSLPGVVRALLTDQPGAFLEQLRILEASPLGGIRRREVFNLGVAGHGLRLEAPLIADRAGLSEAVRQLRAARHGLREEGEGTKTAQIANKAPRD
jgi:hypothetical protein